MFYCGMISTIYHFEFPAQLSANNIRLFSKSTNHVTGWKWIVEIIPQYQATLDSYILEYNCKEWTLESAAHARRKGRQTWRLK